MPAGAGTFEVTGGSCWNINVGSVESNAENSSGQTLVFAVAANDFSLQCHLEGNSDGTMEVNVTLGSSTLDVVVQIDPYVSMLAPDYPLPLGAMNVTRCRSDLVVKHLSIGGTSPIALTTAMMPPDVLASIVPEIVNEPLCDGLREVISDQGTATAQKGANLLGPMLMDPWSPEPSEPLKPLLEWDHYPPILVLQAMVQERFHLWANRAVQILSVTSFESTLVETENVTLRMLEFHVAGVGPSTRPGLAITPEDQDISVLADLHELSLQTKLRLDVTVPGQPALSEDVGIEVGFNNLSIGVRTWIDGPMLDSLSMDDIIQSPGCVIQASNGTANPETDAIAVTDLHVSMLPLLAIQADGSLEQDLTALFNGAVSALHDGYLPTLNRLVNGALAIARHPLNREMWKRILALPECTRATLFMGVNENIIVALWCGAFVLFTLAVLIPGLVHVFYRRNSACSARTVGSAGMPSAMGGGAVIAGIAATKSNEDISDSGCSTYPRAATGHLEDQLSLAKQPFVAPALAIMFPMVISGTVLLFLFADLDIGATVSVVTYAEGRSSTIGPIFSFSLLSTIVHSWNSGAYVISLLTLLPSGVWPFVKLGMLLAAWLLPPARLGAKKRGLILDFLDTWGKYSFIDSWFLVLSMSAFALQWESVGRASMKVETSPTSAFYAFFVATCLSLVLGHVASECHRRTQPCEMTAPCSDSETKALGSLHSSKAIRFLVSGLLYITAALTVVGAAATTFDFKSGGLSMEFVFGKPLIKEYSLVSIGMMVADNRYSDLGLISLEVVFLTLAIGVPLVELGLLAILWLAPLRTVTQRVIVLLCQFLDAWASLDVAALVLVIACFQFGLMAEFLVYKSGFAAGCVFIKDLTRQECLEVEMIARPMMLALVLAGLLMVTLPKFVLRLSKPLVALRAQQATLRKKTIGVSSDTLGPEVSSGLGPDASSGVDVYQG